MIVIHTGGNEKIGVGNLSRCKTLANSLIKLGINNLYMIYEASNEIAKAFLPNEKVNLIVVESRDESIKLREKLSKRSKDKVKILITDIYDLNKDDEILSRNQGYDTLIHMNDSSIPEYKADYMIDQEAFIKPWLNSPEIEFIRGGEYSIIRPEIAKLRPKESWNKEVVRRVLFCFGGSDPEHCIEDFIKYINKERSLDKFLFDVVVGPGVIEERWIDIKKNLFSNVNYKRKPCNLPTLMSEADVIVTIGGITSYEGMCLGKPILCISCGKMKYYIKELDKLQLVRDIGDADEAFCNLINILNEVETLKFLAKNGYEQVDDKGAERIAKRIVDIHNRKEGNIKI